MTDVLERLRQFVNRLMFLIPNPIALASERLFSRLRAFFMGPFAWALAVRTEGLVLLVDPGYAAVAASRACTGRGSLNAWPPCAG